MAEALAVSIAMCVFALFARTSAPLFYVAPASLVAVAVVLGRSIDRPGARAMWGWTGGTHRTPAILVAMAFGLLLALAYRAIYGPPTFPLGLTKFAAPAGAIGAAEELVYRGYVQGRVAQHRSGFWLAPVLGALSHTAYKSALFALPGNGAVHLPRLAILTFLVGAGLGALRQSTGSVFPPLATHVLFDVITYGDQAGAPWWVWG